MENDIKYEKLDPKIIKSWRKARGIFLSIVTLIYIAFCIIMFILDVNMPILLIVAVLFFLVIVAIISLIIIPKIQYKRWAYYIGEDRVQIQKGLFFIKTDTIPIVRLQHITTARGIINRSFGLGTLTMSTASGSFTIVGLTDEKCAEFSLYLKNRLILRLENEGKEE